MTFLALQPVVLASSSTTRRAMLESAGLEVLVEPARVDEDEFKHSCRVAGRSAPEVAEALAALKAERVALRFPGYHVIGADQMLECDGTWYDKPVDAAAARQQLAALAGRTHRLHSASVVFHGGVRIWQGLDSATLTMRPLSAEFLDRYFAEAGPLVLQSVGGYQLEGLGVQLFSKVKGDHFTILGLPLFQLLAFLRTRGVLPS